MRLVSFLAFMLFLCPLISAQNLPISEENGHVEFIEVVNVPGASSEQLYNRALKWFDEFYTNAGSVIQEKEPNAKLFGKHRINLYADVSGKSLHQGFVNYYIEIGFKDGRYRYKVYEMYMVKGVKVFIKDWIDSGAPNQDVLNSYLAQVEEFTGKLTSSLKETLGKPLAEESADDW